MVLNQKNPVRLDRYWQLQGRVGLFDLKNLRYFIIYIM